MRTLVLLLAFGASAVTVALLLRPGAAERGPSALGAAAQGDPNAPAWMRLRYGTITVRVNAPDGTVPPGAQAGYETEGAPRLYYVDAQGARVLTDVPLGEVRLVAEAPGFQRLTRAARLEPGVPEEVRLVLTPAPLSPNR